LCRDLQPAKLEYQPLTLEDLARLLAGTAEPQRWMLVLEFLEQCLWADQATRRALIDAEPPLIDNDRWDVLLGAVCEYVARSSGIATPAWSASPIRLWCGRIWFLSDLQSVRASALATSPGPFRARGIFLEPRDLTRDGVDLAGSGGD
jgi:hypothetical protein